MRMTLGPKRGAPSRAGPGAVAPLATLQRRPWVYRISLLVWTAKVSCVKTANGFFKDSRYPRTLTFLSADSLCQGGDSVVGIATRYGLDGPGIESRRRRDIPYTSRPVLGSTQPPIPVFLKLCVTAAR